MNILQADTNAARRILPLLMLLAAGAAQAQASDAAASDEPRVAVTTQMPASQRAAGAPGSVSEHEYAALQTATDKSIDKRSTLRSAASPAAATRAVNSEFWFYSADVVLFNDHDRDGHYHGIDLLFDADTYYDYAEVYAVVYLSLDGGPWNEYAATDVFSISGTAADDDYVIVTELVSGYPTGSYDLLIELFDTYDNSFVASYGPEDTPELAFLALEDANRDTPVADTVIVRQRGGGSLGWLTLLPLLGTALLAKLRQKRA